MSFLNQTDKDKWPQVLTKLEQSMSAVSFDLWVKGLEPLERKGQLMYLISPNEMAITQIVNNHAATLNAALDQVYNCTSFKILTTEEHADYIKARKEARSETQDEQNSGLYSYEFNPKYSFENFVVGKSNQVAYAAAYAVCEEPAKRFNPLFIYGGAGLGKTHILHSIGNYFRSNHPKMKITYVTCERFTNDYIDAMRYSKDAGAGAFRAKYRGSDVLLVDDIQFISNKMGTQEEFFHTFNDLYQNGRQIILTSDRPPKEIPALEERLRSRFASGLLQDIGTPDFETRVAILQKKAQVENQQADDEVFYFIAEKVESNIREMEGLLSKVCFYANLMGKNKATILHAQEALKHEYTLLKERLTPDKLIDTVCKYFNLARDELLGRKKNKEIVEPRMICVFLMTELLDIPLTAIGKIFNRDHTTVIHARDKITEDMRRNSRLKTTVNDLRSMLNNV